MKVGMPRIRPARTGAVEVKPPIPRTTCGLNLRKIARQTRKAFVEAPNKRENRGRKRRGQRDGRQFLEAKIRSPLDREGVDLLLGNEEQRLVPALAQHFRHGETGKEMPARSSTCDHGVHEEKECESRVRLMAELLRSSETTSRDVIRFSGSPGPASPFPSSARARARPVGKYSREAQPQKAPPTRFDPP